MNFSEVIWNLAFSQKKLDAAFNEMRKNVDVGISEMHEKHNLFVDKALERMLLNGEPELMKLMKSSRTVQDRWLLKLRKKLGLTGKGGNISKMKKVSRALPSADEMFKGVQAGKPIMSYPVIHKEDDSELETCIINHVENDGMTREEAIVACRKNTDATGEREEALNQADKSRVKSTEDLFKALMDKKGHARARRKCGSGSRP